MQGGTALAIPEEPYDKRKERGFISSNLLCLQLQVNSLLAEAGGDRAVELLDGLAELSDAERQLALASFSRVVNRIRAGEQHLVSSDEIQLQKLEDDLYRDILLAMRDASSSTKKRPHLEVVRGAKKDPTATPEAAAAPGVVRSQRGI